MQQAKLTNYSVYRTVIEQAMGGCERLPSMPALTLQIRCEMSNPNTTHQRIARLVEQDPSLCAILMKQAYSPLYRTLRRPENLEDIIALIGMKDVDAVVMAHSVRSLFVMRDPKLKALFKIAWKRLITKSAFSTMLASIIRYPNDSQVMMTSLLSEIGTLAVLSAFNEFEIIPDEEDYYALCREYSKSLGTILLKKWSMDESYITAVKRIGDWGQAVYGRIDEVDIINLGLHHAVRLLDPETDLPDLIELAAYEKLSPAFNEINNEMQLDVLAQHHEDIECLISTFC